MADVPAPAKPAHNRHLQPEAVREIRRLTAEGKTSFAEMGRMFGCSTHIIRNIRLGRTYQDVT